MPDMTDLNTLSDGLAKVTDIAIKLGGRAREKLKGLKYKNDDDANDVREMIILVQITLSYCNAFRELVFTEGLSDAKMEKIIDILKNGETNDVKALRAVQSHLIMVLAPEIRENSREEFAVFLMNRLEVLATMCEVHRKVSELHSKGLSADDIDKAQDKEGRVILFDFDRDVSGKVEMPPRW